MLFGDSLFGQFGRKPITALEKAVPGIMVYNCAAGGLNSAESLARAPLISKMDADYTCISLGANDCSRAEEVKYVPLDMFRNNLISIIDIFKRSKVILFPCPPLYDPLDQAGTEEYNNLLDPYNKAIVDIASEKKVTCIDSKAIYGELLRENKDYHKEDGIHLNGFGYEVLVKELTRLLK